MSDIEKVKQLREATGAGFKDCNLAIKESGGDLDKAVEILRVKGISKASKKMSRDAKEGVIATSGDENKISIIEVNCETDFVAKNDDFVLFAKELSELNNQAESNIEKLSETKMSNGETVKDSLVALIAKMGEKITIGRAKTFNNSGSKNFNYLHTVVKDNLSKLSVIVSLEVKDVSDQTIGRAKTFNNSGSKNFNYLHTVVKDNLSKLSVIVSLEVKDASDQVKTFGKQLAMHIAASSPLSLNADSIDKDLIQKELELVTEELKSSGKPDEIVQKISLGKMNKFKEENASPLSLNADSIDKDLIQKELELVTEELKSSGKPDEIVQKISLGKMNKFKEENALLTQAWVMEPKKKVQDIVKELNISGLKINDFYRLKIGE